MVGFWVFFFPLHATLFLGFSPTAISTASPSSHPTMARMNRPAPVEVCYKNMRFLITHNPTNATLSTFLEVRRGGWKLGTRVQLHVLGLKANIEMQQGSTLCRMRQQSIPFGTTAPGGIPGRRVRSPPAFWGWMFWRTPGVMSEHGGGGAEFPRSCCIPCQLHQHITSRGFAGMPVDARNLPCISQHLNKDFPSQISQRLSNAQSVLGSAQDAGGLGVT